MDFDELVRRDKVKRVFRGKRKITIPDIISGSFVEVVQRQSCDLPGFFGQDIMGADRPEDQVIFGELKSESVFHGNGSFPPVFCPLYPLDPK